MRRTSRRSVTSAAQILLVTLSLLLATAAQGDEPAPDQAKPDSGATTTGFWQELHTRVPTRSADARSGEEVYQYRCKGCHGRNTQGAPLPGDRDAWKQRAEQGMEVLMRHTVDGYQGGLMPPRGGCRDCSNAELKAAVLYMMNAEPDAGLKQLTR